VHRNPNVQIFSLEVSCSACLARFHTLLTLPLRPEQLANSLYQNCGKLLHLELTSRAWTGAMDRLITDRTTVQQVKNKAVGYVNTWWQGLKGGEAEGVMGDLIETLKTKSE
jgi:signal transducing adaptor molecule